MNLIGITGKAGTGKSEVANMFAELFDYHIIAFADPIKEIARKVFEFSPVQLYGPSDLRNKPDKRYERPVKRLVCNEYHHHTAACMEPEYLTPRHVLLSLGDWGRNCFKDIWVVRTFRAVRELEEFGVPGVVIPDVRMENEWRAIRKHNGKLVLVRRGSTTLKGEQARHETETTMPEDEGFYDYVLDNSGDLEQLREQVQELRDVLF
jgi:hypothetical protein